MLCMVPSQAAGSNGIHYQDGRWTDVFRFRRSKYSPSPLVRPQEVTFKIQIK
jgi:hypothetical protein